MAGKKGKAEEMGKSQTPSLGGTVLRMLAVGIVGGIALIAGAKKIGDNLLESGAREESKRLEDSPIDKIEGGSN